MMFVQFQCHIDEINRGFSTCSTFFLRRYLLLVNLVYLISFFSRFPLMEKNYGEERIKEDMLCCHHDSTNTQSRTQAHTQIDDVFFMDCVSI